MNEEEIKNYLIQVRYNLRKETIHNIMKTNTFEEMIEILQSTRYRKIVQNITEEEIEKSINKYLYTKYKQIFAKSKYNICSVIAYMYLEEYQQANIINILGGINYNLPKEEIQNKIIM